MNEIENWRQKTTAHHQIKQQDLWSGVRVASSWGLGGLVDLWSATALVVD
jgi:hypothetical protein